MEEEIKEEMKNEQDQIEILRGRAESKNNTQPNSLADLNSIQPAPKSNKKLRLSRSNPKSSNKGKKTEASNDAHSNDKKLFAKLFGRTHKTENVVNMDLIETQAGLDSRAQYGDVRDLMQTDATGRTMIHRAALEQNSKLLNELCEEAAKTNNKLAFIDRKDKFGNTPLLLSCLLNYPGSSVRRARCLEIFLSHKVDINVKNDRTMWTAVMWCAYYGDERGLKKLLEAKEIGEEKAKCYSPDYKGFFPFDWAGLKGHRKSVEILLQKLMYEIEFIERVRGEQEKYLRSPLLRSSLLYWACHYKFDISIIQKLLSFSDVIPEFPINCVKNKTSLHACCEAGYEEALKLLLEKSKNIYEGNIVNPRSNLLNINQDFGIKADRSQLMLPLTKEEKRKFKKKFLKALQNMSAWYSTYIAKSVTRSKYNFFDCKDKFGKHPTTFSFLLWTCKLRFDSLENG